MKYLILPIISILLISCSDNNPVDLKNNPNPTTDTIILFTKDSIYAFPNHYRDSVEFTSSVSIDTLYVSFTYQSQNVIRSFIRSYTFHTFIDTIPLIHTENFNLKFPINSTFTCKTYLELIWPTGSSYYASLKNIRLFSINR